MGDISSGRGDTANAVPPELLKTVVELIQAAEDRGERAPTVEEIAIQLRQIEGKIKRACEALESQGLVRASQAAAEHTNPGYTITREGTTEGRGEETAARDRIVNSLLRATSRVFKTDLGIDLRLAGGEVRHDQVTTEDLSVFVRVTGSIEGCVFFGLDRTVARELLTIVLRRPPPGIDQRALRILNTLVDRISGLARVELAAAGYSVDISPASTVQPIGMRITTLGVPQVVATLQSKRGPVVVHVVLREAPDRDALAA